jgi:glycosyltransferase involved in cell wall biosynthesis
MNFSVCICVYNKDNINYFKEALESIVNQSLVPNQVVLVVDGPINDGLQNIIDNFQEKSLTLMISFEVTYLKENKGHGEARRLSIENAKYNLIALMDADDISRYNRFELQLDIFKNDNNLSIVGGQIMEIAHDTKKEISIREVPVKDKEIKQYLKTRCPFNQMSVMFKKDDVIKAGNYIDFYHNEDYYLWVRMYLNNCQFYNIPEILLDVRINEEFYNRRGGWKYFLSEFKLQRIMYKNSIISLYRFIFNSSVRFLLQVVLTNSIRGFIFKKLFRKKV